MWQNIIIIVPFFRSPELVIVDMGCGNAKISQSVPNKVFSFDLVAVNNRVTVCDMAKVLTSMVIYTMKNMVKYKPLSGIILVCYTMHLLQFD